MFKYASILLIVLVVGFAILAYLDYKAWSEVGKGESIQLTEQEKQQLIIDASKGNEL